MTSKLAPGFLVAAPELRDPNFVRSVVLLCVCNSEGALGFVVNRPSDGVSLRDVLEALTIPMGKSPSADVLYGGPVRPEAGWLIYDPRTLDPSVAVIAHDPQNPPSEGAAVPDDVPAALSITPSLHVTSSRSHLECLARGQGPHRFQLVLGYAGWGPGQLESEIASGAWITGDLDEDILFDTPIDERWERVLSGQGINPALLHRAAVDA